MASAAKNGPAGDGLSADASEPRSVSGRQSSIHAGSLESGRGNLRTKRTGKAPLQCFQKKTAALKAKAKGDTLAERAKWLAHFRDGEGYMAQFINNKDGGPRILECHSPILQSARALPDHRQIRAGHVRSGPRHARAPASDSQLGAVRVRVSIRDLGPIDRW